MSTYVRYRIARFLHGGSTSIMDIRVLRYFIEIVREGNISAAAKHLHVSQPALSRQIMDLEENLGVTLFERGHRQIKLTQEGYYLYERAKEITALVNKTEYNLRSHEVISGTLDIGGGESCAMQIIMDVLNDILKEYPNIRINLISGDASVIQRRLDDGSIDFGVMMGPNNLGNYNSLVLPEKNQWGILLRKDDPLAQKKAITPEDLLGHSLITSYQTKNGEAFREWAGSLINKLHFVGQYNLIYNAALLVRSGTCFALTYKGLIREDEAVVFRPLFPTLVDVNTLIWNKDQNLPNIGTLFIQKLKEKIDQKKNSNS